MCLLFYLLLLLLLLSTHTPVPPVPAPSPHQERVLNVMRFCIKQNLDMKLSRFCLIRVYYFTCCCCKFPCSLLKIISGVKHDMGEKLGFSSLFLDSVQASLAS